MFGRELLLPAIVFIPFAGAILALLLGRIAGRWTGLLMVATALASFLQCVWLAASQPLGEPVTFLQPWMPALGSGLHLRGDPFGLFFALLISGIGTLVGIYSLGYMSNVPAGRLGQFYAAFQAFMGSMLGVALADDLILFFVFWEITSVTSFLLIGFWYEQEQARKGAMTALQITALGGLAMMVGFVCIWAATGSWSISQLAQRPDLQQALTRSPLFVPAMLLVFIGAMTKSAQWPFHFWLPAAMVAPTPVSTYLHAATMVKAGVFLLGRALPLFGASPLWAGVLVPIGLLTFALGAIQALRASDLKAILANTTVSTLGLLTLLFGVGAAHQVSLQLFSHAVYKGALFLIAGIVEHSTHTRDLRQLGGLRKALPITCWIFVFAGLSMAGLPPFLGYLAKEVFYAELLQSPLAGRTAFQGVVIVLSLLANATLFAVSFKLIIGLFLGAPTPHARHAREARPVMWVPAALLGASTLVLAVLAPVTERFVNAFSAGQALHGGLHLVPEHLGPVVLTLLTVTLGVLLYRHAQVLVFPVHHKRVWPTLQELWDGLIDATTRSAIAFSRRWQSGSLRWYISGTLAFTVLLSGFALWRAGISVARVTVNLAEMQWYGLLLCGMLALTAVLVVKSTTRIGASIAMTANGFLTALLFVVYRSPDILLTQILIETVSTIFILLILYYMPPFRSDGWSAMRRLSTLTISAIVGLAMFTFIVLSTSPEFRETKNLARDYLTRSLAEAGGANAVNVIIVDFRAIDTNGEITVLLVVGLLAYGLLRVRRKTP